MFTVLLIIKDTWAARVFSHTSILFPSFPFSLSIVPIFFSSSLFSPQKKWSCVPPEKTGIYLALALVLLLCSPDWLLDWVCDSIASTAFCLTVVTVNVTTVQTKLLIRRRRNWGTFSLCIFTHMYITRKNDEDAFKWHLMRRREKKIEMDFFRMKWNHHNYQSCRSTSNDEEEK